MRGKNLRNGVQEGAKKQNVYGIQNTNHFLVETDGT